MNPWPRTVISSFVMAALVVGLAWAGSSPAPRPPTVTAAASLETGEVLAGSALVSMRPTPEAYGGTWETDLDKCQTLGPNPEGIREGATHVIDTRVRWHENPNCLYMGGYGLGPIFPITNWDDPYGLWVRSAAMGDAEGDLVVLTLIDGAYYFGKYNNMCDGQQDCGFFDLQQSMASELGVPASSFLFASTHSHTSPDFIGAWGGVPKWYMAQIEDSIKTSVRAAVESMRPATLEMGETYARQFSSERRDFYRSAEDQNLAWFRAIDASAEPAPPPPPPQCEHDRPGRGPECPAPAEAAPGEAIFTIGAFAAHPVTEDTESGTADADFPAVFSKAVENRWGGVGMLFQTGLGNISPRDGGHPEGTLPKEKIGYGLASVIGDVGEARVVEVPDVESAQTFWDQPVTNSVLAGLGMPGFFDRPFNNMPAAVDAGKPGQTSPGSARRCRSASPLSVRTAVSAVKIGPLWVTGGPGELFSNLTNTVKEKNPTGVTLPLALVNDGLGYIMQSFETDHGGRQGAGFVGQVVEYEDAYSIDHCFGDMTLETTLQLLGTL